MAEVAPRNLANVHAPDALLFVACALLVLVGPAMAFQELLEAEDDAAFQVLTGRAATPDYAFRAAWRTTMFAGLVVIGVLSTLVIVRVVRRRRVREVTGRLVGLLLLGSTLFDLAFVFDAQALTTAAYLVRASVVLVAYPAAGLVMAASLARLVQVERAFIDERPALAR